MELIDINEVCEITKLSKSTVFKKIKDGTFPEIQKTPSPSSRGPRLVNRWDKAKVIAWAFDDDVQELDDIEDEKLRVPYGDAFLEEARKGEGSGPMDWDEPISWAKKISRHRLFIPVIILAIAAMLYSLLT
jgi:predicted DNA-binding transcriptional regulator AlpA|tara:strand:+ start:1837 stop:2229 length:393 start_codon:yes stop_codon:yes gene_type:complete